MLNGERDVLTDQSELSDVNLSLDLVLTLPKHKHWCRFDFYLSYTDWRHSCDIDMLGFKFQFQD